MPKASLTWKLYLLLLAIKLSPNESNTKHFRRAFKSVFRSDTSNCTDEDFLRWHSDYWEVLRNPNYIHAARRHAFVVELNDDCDGTCHQSLRTASPMKRYHTTNSKFGQVVATPLEMVQLAGQLSLVKTFFPMLPEIKVDHELFVIAKKCSTSPTKDSVTVHVAVCALTPSMLLVFIQSLEVISTHFSLPILHDTSGLIADEPGMMTVVASCLHLPVVLEQLTALPEVLWVEERLPVVPHNRWAKGVCQTGSYASAPIYAANITGYEHIIGIVDTGMDMFSCHLYDPKVPAPFDVVSFKHRKVITYITTFGDRVDDGEAHGTHVGSTVAGLPYQNYGDYAKYSGIAFNSKIAFIDIGNTETGVLTIPPDLYNQAFKPLYDLGARIFTNSWGSTGASANKYTAESQSVDKFMSDYPDSLIFYAAGNEGDLGWNTVGSPSTNKNGICAGASLNDRYSWMAYSGSGVSSVFGVQSMGNFSSKGPTADGRRKPDLVGPGWWVTSASGYPDSAAPHCDVKGMRGTSMSSPVLAANAVLVREYFLKGFYPTGSANKDDGFNPSGALIKAVMLHSGQPLEEVVDDKGRTFSTHGYPSSVQGYGRIQLDEVLNIEADRKPSVNLYAVGAVSSSHPYYAALATSGKSHSYVLFTSSSTTRLRVTLAYTDAYGSVGSATVLVNDLDLSLHSKAGETYLPIPDNANSQIENVEQIILNNPLPYTNYTIRVSAKYVTGTQPYALVITGHFEAYNASDLNPDELSSKHLFDRLAEISPAVMNVIIAQCIAFSVLLLIVLSVTISNCKSDYHKYIYSDK